MADVEGESQRDLPLAQLAALQRAFETRLAGADLQTPVLSCGAWSVRELAEHLGSVHVWAAGKVLGETLSVPEADSATLHRDLSDPHLAASRYGAGAHLLRTTLASVPADQPCQTLNGEGPTSFWQRRQTHETLIHLWDLCRALGSPMPHLNPEIWADCLAEVVEVMHPRQVRLDRTHATELPLLLVAEDVDLRWRLSGTDSTDSTESGTAPAAVITAPAAVITAPAAELALLLWGRRSLAGLDVSGDLPAAESILAGALTP